MTETVTASHILVDTKGMKAQEELDKTGQRLNRLKELDEGVDFAGVQRNIPTARRERRAGISVRFPGTELW